ncbi:N-ethylmaleimide-sensitive factor [Theileria orientalis strain Shintoku]|uniref:Vesicle-fusing ATPase n=1 Tax=Theileria orientalis strain Shintoku TaxID=869250 RepID=J4C362_THEOR|nr:N-ethylmaleimide-sensitive factor [Theileria orientalis strain Shintoku]BAM39886.1 N-ethylmaleimide-sensitive factor [Theileria orientalis strain Shintoku]|eukprot:XP_009690187.1 N-ethylmaleimide-sensitive factor [Theileria orientalis strain Shintoku]
MKAVVRIVRKLPDESLTYTNCVYVNRELYENLKAESLMAYATIEGMVFCARYHPTATAKDVFMNSCARELIKVAVGETVTVSAESTGQGVYGHQGVASLYPAADRIVLQVSHFRPQNKGRRSQMKNNNVFLDLPFIEFEKLEQVVKSNFLEHVLHETQTIPILLEKTQLKLKVSKLFSNVKDPHSLNLLMKARLVKETKLEFGYKTLEGAELQISDTQSIFKPNFKFEELGIGGLDDEFADIFRRAFASRIYPPEILKELGISHVKGLLLYGPPGTGKTLIARQISKALNCSKLKTVNGPEVMSRFFGQSEENIRNLFLDAENEYARLGDRSGLHIIIFDEIDSICQRRGTDMSGTVSVRDAEFKKLLSKIDGVDSLNNILLIGMTNRLDMIDEALLRPGRFEVHIEVGLPDEDGRQQILKIHTRVMRESNRLSEDVDLDYVVKQTKNYSGAELEGLVKCAVSYAIQRHVDGSDLSKPKNIDQIIVKQSDFNSALVEVKPAYGVDSMNLNMFSKHGIIPFGNKFHQVLETCTTLAKQVSRSEKTPVLSVLLHGAVGCGKSALAAHVASMADFPFVKVISPELYIGLSELAKVNAIHKAFDDAHKTPQSLIILDNIERLIDYSPIGPRFSNNILQSLLVLIKKAPQHERRIFVIGTTSEEAFMDMANVTAAFTVSTQVPLVTGPSEIYQALSGVKLQNLKFSKEEIYLVANSGKIPEIGIKHLLLALEIAIQKTKDLGKRFKEKWLSGSTHISSTTFLESLEACGYF